MKTHNETTLGAKVERIFARIQRRGAGEMPEARPMTIEQANADLLTMIAEENARMETSGELGLGGLA